MAAGIHACSTNACRRTRPCVWRGVRHPRRPLSRSPPSPCDGQSLCLHLLRWLAWLPGSPPICNVYVGHCCMGGAWARLPRRSSAAIVPLPPYYVCLALLTASIALQWRETRTLPSAIKELKAQLPAKNEEGERPASPLDDELEALEQVLCTLTLAMVA